MCVTKLQSTSRIEFEPDTAAPDPGSNPFGISVHITLQNTKCMGSLSEEHSFKERTINGNL